MDARFIRPRYRAPARHRPTPAQASPPAGVRLLAYLGTGCIVALTPTGAIVAQADHLTEALRLEDLALAE
jgi:hypothetical protein